MIPIQDARGVFTKELVYAWNELNETQAKGFLRSFFQKTTSNSLEVSIEVVRGTEKVAVDVLRGTDGNRNSITKSAEKIFVPPFYNENIDIVGNQKFDALFGVSASNIDTRTLEGLIMVAIDSLTPIKKKIERAYEKQAAEVFESGIVQVATGTNIDFKRKAMSMVDATSAAYFNNPLVDPEAVFINAGNFLRRTGKATDGRFNVIMGENVYPAFKNNPFIKDKNYNTNIQLIDLKMPQADAEGGLYMGRYTAGPYIFELWTYPEGYENSSGTWVNYINANQAIFLPVTSGKFILAHGAVPTVVATGMPDMPQAIRMTEGDYVIQNYVDAAKKSHVFEMLSSGLTIPVSVDRIYTLTAYGDVTNPVGA